MSTILSIAAWNILSGKPVPENIAAQTVEALREHPDYIKKVIDLAKDDKPEVLSKNLAKHAEEYRRSPNQSSKIKPKFIMLHHTAGSFAGSISWILNAIAKVSYHYVINPKTGARVQTVWDSSKAWHAGKTFWKGYSGLNSHSVSIAFAGDTNKRTPSHLEIDSAARKCIYLMIKFDLAVDDIITHQMAAPDRKNDCSKETFLMVIKRVNELLKK